MEKLNFEKPPWVTYIIMGINILVYLLTAFLSNDIMLSDYHVLIFLGAKVNELISAGEYYRLVTCIFLHGGLIHLALNMYSLYIIGPLVEKVYGRVKYIAIYFIAGIVASLFSFVFSKGLSIGASGAIFGLLGATLIFAITIKKTIGKDFYNNILQVMVVNLIIGFSIPNIDNFAHIGGILGGMTMGKVFQIYKKR
jgi:rhomboid protease GluP